MKCKHFFLYILNTVQQSKIRKTFSQNLRARLLIIALPLCALFSVWPRNHHHHLLLNFDMVSERWTMAADPSKYTSLADPTNPYRLETSDNLALCLSPKSSLLKISLLGLDPFIELFEPRISLVFSMGLSTNLHNLTTLSFNSRNNAMTWLCHGCITPLACLFGLPLHLLIMLMKSGLSCKSIFHLKMAHASMSSRRR